MLFLLKKLDSRVLCCTTFFLDFGLPKECRDVRLLKNDSSSFSSVSVYCIGLKSTSHILLRAYDIWRRPRMWSKFLKEIYYFLVSALFFFATLFCVIIVTLPIFYTETSYEIYVSFMLGDKAPIRRVPPVTPNFYWVIPYVS